MKSTFNYFLISIILHLVLIDTVRSVTTFFILHGFERVINEKKYIWIELCDF